jgi:hypothetical protein
MYFQLVPSTLPTDGTGFGLLPTATTADVNMDRFTTEGAKKRHKEGKFQPSLALQAKIALLPTPIASDIHHAERVQQLKESGAETMASRKNGASRPNGLMDYLDFNNLLPTPTTAEAKNQEYSTQTYIQNVVGANGQTSQLNPPFVLEMMGFPPDWTVSPFLNGETNQSKLLETPSSPK